MPFFNYRALREQQVKSQTTSLNLLKSLIHRGLYRENNHHCSPGRCRHFRRRSDFRVLTLFHNCQLEPADCIRDIRGDKDSAYGIDEQVDVKEYPLEVRFYCHLIAQSMVGQE